MKRVCFAFVFVLSIAAIGFGQSSFYYPHIADGIQEEVNLRWRTTIFLTNPSQSGMASGSIVFYQDTGNSNLSVSGFPLNSITFRDETGATANVGNAIAFQLGPGQSRKYTSTGNGTYAGGYAVVSFTGSVMGTALFSEFDTTGKRLIGEAGVPASPAVQKQALFVDTIDGYNVGFALANPQAVPALVTATLFNTNGVQLASTSHVLGPNNHFAKFVDLDLFPDAPSLAGTLQISSNVPLSAIALRFDPSFSVFTSLAPVTIAAIFSEPLDAIQRLIGGLFAHSSILS